METWMSRRLLNRRGGAVWTKKDPRQRSRQRGEETSEGESSVGDASMSGTALPRYLEEGYYTIV